MRSTPFFRWLVLGSVILLQACADFGPALKPAADEAAGRAIFEARVPALAALDSWRLSGRVSVSNDTESWQASLYWRQRGAGYDAVLTGPLGQGAVELRGDGQSVELQMPDGSKVYDQSAQALVAARLGWQLPLDALQYWVRGIAAPGESELLAFSANGECLSLRQFDWLVEYKHYAEVQGVVVPSKLFLSKAEWQVRLVIDEWRVGGDELATPSR